MLKHTLRALAIVAAALTLTACGGWLPDLAKAYGTASTTEVPVTKADAQKALAGLYTAKAAVVSAMTAYVKQPACGSAGALQPPLCASLRAGLEMKRLNDALNTSLADAEMKIAAVGDNPSALTAIIEGAKLAFSTYKNFVAVNTGAKL